MTDIVEEKELIVEARMIQKLSDPCLF